MKRLLEKISWGTRRWNYEFELFNLQLNSQPGFNLFTIISNHKDYSLLSFKFRLPNKTNVKSFVIDGWDILFLYNHLWKQYDDLSDNELWGMDLSLWDKIKLHILNKVFN